MKKRHLIEIICIAIIVMLFVSNVIVRANGYSSIIDVFFDEGDKKILNDSISSCNQSIIIDDYKISLLSETYDEKNKQGYCEFEVSKNNGNDNIELEKLESSNGFFLNRFQFLFDINGSVVCDITYKKNHNIVKMYVDFSISADKYDGKIYVFDYDSEKDSGIDNCEDYFELFNTLQSIEFESEDGTIINVSPLSIQVVETNNIDENDTSILINYKDKESIYIVNYGKLSNLVKRYSYSYFDNSDNFYLQYEFKHTIDIESIESITYNGRAIINKRWKNLWYRIWFWILWWFDSRCTEWEDIMAKVWIQYYPEIKELN